jgi:hypothetical protein
VLHNPSLCLDKIQHFLLRVFHPPTLVCLLDSSHFLDIFHQLRFLETLHTTHAIVIVHGREFGDLLTCGTPQQLNCLHDRNPTMLLFKKVGGLDGHNLHGNFISFFHLGFFLPNQHFRLHRHRFHEVFQQLTQQLIFSAVFQPGALWSAC